MPTFWSLVLAAVEQAELPQRKVVLVMLSEDNFNSFKDESTFEYQFAPGLAPGEMLIYTESYHAARARVDVEAGTVEFKWREDSQPWESDLTRPKYV